MPRHPSLRPLRTLGGFPPFRPLCFLIPALVLLTGNLPAYAQPDSTNGWGYPLDSLNADLARWRQHPNMRVDSIGLSVQGRPLWRVTVGAEIGEEGGEEASAAKPRVFVHARTHPAEVQAFYVLREMLLFTADTATANTEAAALRRDFTFDFIPMYNPDGVALGLARQNANGVDIEGNWNQAVLQPEVAALKATFQALPPGTASGTTSATGRIGVALNLHSDQVNCSRFFFYHHENGTSAAYAALERAYISGVRAHFPEGIEAWNYIVSWNDGFKPQYPESFWWTTQGTSVMALTYEDTNCPGAGDFYRTGRALALGSADYLRNHPVALAGRTAQQERNGRHGADLPEASLRRSADGPVFILHRNGRVEYRDARGKRIDAATLE